MNWTLNVFFSVISISYLSFSKFIKKKLLEIIEQFQKHDSQLE